MDINQEFRKYATKHRGINGLAFDQYQQHSVEALTPYIIEERPMNVASMDVFSRLMMERIIFLGEPINDYVAHLVTAQHLLMECADSARHSRMDIQCRGRPVE